MTEQIKSLDQLIDESHTCRHLSDETHNNTDHRHTKTMKHATYDWVYDKDLHSCLYLVLLILIYMYPDTSGWSFRMYMYITGVVGLTLFCFLTRKESVRPFSFTHSKTEKMVREGFPSGRSCQQNGCDRAFLDTPMFEQKQSEARGSPDIVQNRIDMITGTPPCGSPLTAPNVRNALISVPNQGCQQQPCNQSVIPPAQFCQTIPQTTDPAFQFQTPPERFRPLSQYSDPEFVLQDPNDPKTWVTTSQDSRPIPKDQPTFYCMYDKNCGFKEFDRASVSQNQNLVGDANPKTRVAPRIPTRLYDISQWTDDPFVVFPGINEQYDQELYQSGYLEGASCDARRRPPRPQPAEGRGGRDKIPISKIQREDFSPPQKIPVSVIENEKISSLESRGAFEKSWTLGKTVDTSMGYYPENISYNTPVNFPYTPSQDHECQDHMNDYNRRTGTIPIQPGINTFSQVNQPDAMMSNLGISFTQPFLPTIPSTTTSDMLEYTEYDPLQLPTEKLDRHRVPSRSSTGETPRHEIYDPRLTGYGTSYRVYNDEMTGQPRFYYDDIEATTQYNYISRNDIDVFPFGMQPGPSIAPVVNEYPSAMDVRRSAEAAFTDNALFHRMDLQQRLMLKNSHRERQRRLAPIHTQNTARC